MEEFRFATSTPSMILILELCRLSVGELANSRKATCTACYTSHWSLYLFMVEYFIIYLNDMKKKKAFFPWAFFSSIFWLRSQSLILLSSSHPVNKLWSQFSCILGICTSQKHLKWKIQEPHMEKLYLLDHGIHLLPKYNKFPFSVFYL